MSCRKTGKVLQLSRVCSSTASPGLSASYKANPHFPEESDEVFGQEDSVIWFLNIFHPTVIHIYFLEGRSFHSQASSRSSWFPSPSSQGCAPAPLAFRRGGLIPAAVRGEACFSPHGNNLESFPACVASLSCVLPSFSLPSGGWQSFNAFMFEKHFEVLEEGAPEERSVITQINCFCFALESQLGALLEAG